MSNAIAPPLDSLLKTNAEVIPWEKLTPSWQTKLQGAIASNTPPSYLISPRSEADLGQIMEIAQQHQVKVIPCGSGSKLDWGGLVKDASWAISTQYLNQVIDHASGDLTVTVEAGIKLQDLQNTLKAVNQFLPIDPSFPDSATIGGIVSTADTGSWRQRYGGIRDLVLGLSFIRADGKIAKAGAKVVKNVAGYDLMKLFTGAYGTLGIISQVTFRVYPIPPASATILLTGDSNGINTLAKGLLISGLTPTAADLISQAMMQELGLGEGWGLIARFQSISESVEQQLAQLNSLAQQLGLKTSYYRDSEELLIWNKFNSLVYPIFCKVGVIPSAAMTVLNNTNNLAMLNLSSGLGKLYSQEENALNELKKTRSLFQQHQGFLTILTAPPSIKQNLDPWGYSGNGLDVMKKIKQQFDHQNLLNPGRFVGGI